MSIPQNPDESYGRETDGDSSMVKFAKCMDDEGNEIITSTPLASNGSINCQSSGVKEAKMLNNSKHVFVKGKDIFVQNAIGSDVRIYSILGNVVVSKKINSNMFDITVPTPGIYLVKVETKCWKVVVE
jgi:hypothetical protein